MSHLLSPGNNGFHPVNILVGAIFLVPLLFTSLLNCHFVFPKFFYLGTVASLLSLVCYREVGKKQAFVIPGGLGFVMLALWVLWLGCTILWAPVTGLALRSWAFRFLCLFLFWFFSVHRIQWKYVVAPIAIAVAFSCGLALLQYYEVDQLILPYFRVGTLFDPANLVMMQRPENHEKIYSTFGHRNYLSGYLIAVIPLLVVASIRSFLHGYGRVRADGIRLSSARTVFCFLGLFSILVASVIVVLLTKTRGAFAGMCFSGFLFVWILGRLKPSLIQVVRKRFHKIAVVFVLIILLIGCTTLPQLRTFAGAFGQKLVQSVDLTTGSGGHRFMIWQGAWEIVTGSPGTFLFGIGVGSFQTEHISATGRVFHDLIYKGRAGAVVRSWYVHNEYLNLLVDSGLLGLSLFLLFLFSLVKSVFMFCTVKENQEISEQWEDGERLYLVALFAGISAVLVHNVFSFTLQLPATGSLFFIFCGILSSRAVSLRVYLYWGISFVFHIQGFSYDCSLCDSLSFSRRLWRILLEEGRCFRGKRV